MTELYVHIPFCKRKCRYCDFNSFKPDSEAIVFSYLAALRREIAMAAEAYNKAKISTVYIGGGTPSMLKVNQLVGVIDKIRGSFDLSEMVEMAVECNPESVSEELFCELKKVGVNRISLGVQSLDPMNLRSIGRLHTRERAIEAISLAKKYFDNVSGDLIIGLPYDTTELVRAEIEELCPMLEHMSVYELILEEGTPLFERVESGKVILPDDDEVAEFSDVAVATLKKQGFERYEVSNFAKGGAYSRHNFGYWTGEEYIGLGAGAHSYILTTDGQNKLGYGVRFAAPSDVNAYIGGVNCSQTFDAIPRVDMSVISPEEEIRERIMLGLRTSKGVRAELLKNKIPAELSHYFIEHGGYLSLTDDGLAVMNSILIRLI